MASLAMRHCMGNYFLHEYGLWIRLQHHKTCVLRRNPLFSHPTDLYPNRATEPKYKLMLAKSPESAYKNGVDRSSILRVIA